VDLAGAGFAEPMCRHHLAMADPALRMRFEVALARLAQVQSYWDDDDRYEKVVASGRYLKLANATGWATEAAEAAWDRLKLDVFRACTVEETGARTVEDRRAAS